MKKAIAVLVVTAVALGALAESRVWTQVNGQTLEGEFKEMKATSKGVMTVYIILKEDGKLRGIPLSRLSDADQAVAKSLAGE